tara:strand:+ start:464 stop:658 length:195 start_codon:yes stop_codon:yes gene_type:complete
MSYEAGSKECRNLIDAKENLLSAMDSLSSISEAENIMIQLKQIYNTLEDLHDRRRVIEETAKTY